MILVSHHGQLGTSEEENVVFLTLLCKMHCMAVGGFVTGTGICVRQAFVWLQIAGTCGNSGMVLYKWICVRKRCKETLFVKRGVFFIETKFG